MPSIINVAVLVVSLQCIRIARSLVVGLRTPHLYPPQLSLPFPLPLRSIFYTAVH